MIEKSKKIIKNLGLVYKILSGFMFFSGVMGLLVYSIFVISFGYFPPISDGLFRQSTILSFLFKNFAIFALGQIIISGFVFYASFKFLKYQSWARKVLEVFSWLIIGFIILFAILSITIITFRIPLLVKVMFTASICFWAVPILILIWFIKKKEVVEAFKNN